MPADCFVLRAPTFLPNIRISRDYHPTFMLILGRVPRSFIHLQASSCGFRPLDPGIIYKEYSATVSAPEYSISFIVLFQSDGFPYPFPCCPQYGSAYPQSDCVYRFPDVRYLDALHQIRLRLPAESVPFPF